MWTMDNTEGFAQEQLDLINDAIERLVDEGLHSLQINDLVNNCWHNQKTSRQLFLDVMDHLDVLRDQQRD